MTEEISGCDGTEPEEMNGCDGLRAEETIGLRTDAAKRTSNSGKSGNQRCCDETSTEDSALGGCDDLMIEETEVVSNNASNSGKSNSEITSSSVMSRGCDGAETEETITGCTELLLTSVKRVHVGACESLGIMDGRLHT